MDEQPYMDPILLESFDEIYNGEMEEVSDLSNPSNSLESNFHGSQVEISEHDTMLSLTEKNFQSREDLLGIVREIALKQGYATVIRRSKADKYVIIGCDRGGNYRNTNLWLEDKKRKTASRLINCPFEIWGKKKQEGFWKVDIKNLSHNHDPSTDMSGHPYCRRFSEDEILCIKQMTMAGIPPRQILSSLRQSNPNLQAIAQSVYNERYKIMKQSLGGRTVVQALLDELGQGGFTYNIEYDQNGHLTHLFFAHPISIALTKSYSNVFVMDCTYKTNKYKMSLLDIIGVSSFNTSFYSCFAFMQKEEEADYVWALTMFSKLLGIDNHPVAIISDRELALMKAIESVFPKTTNILCVWHIEKNILTNCKSHFENEDDWVNFISTWTSLIQSLDESSFNEAWSCFEVKYKDKYNNSVLKYITATWLPFKEKFVSAWTEQVMHFGNRVSSRAEGAHAMLKKYLQVSTGGLREVQEKICLAIENQFQEIKVRLSSEKIRVSHRLRIPFFKELVTHVSMFALDELHKQYGLAKSTDVLSRCKGHFFKTMGLPCAHMIREMRSEMQLKDVHEQWRIDTRSFGDVCDVNLDGDRDEISDLLADFKSKYEKMPISEKESTKRQLSQFLCASLPLILEPTIQAHKGRPSKSKKRKESNSTQREPSSFEIVENSRKCRCWPQSSDLRTQRESCMISVV